MKKPAPLKDVIKKQYLMCAKDPVYFMKKYCMIQHPTRGRIQFNLYTFQEKVLGLLNKNERNIILKSRQLGISTLTAGMSLWYMLFQKDINVLLASVTKKDKDFWEDIQRNDTYLSAEQCLEYGLVDKVI